MTETEHLDDWVIDYLEGTLDQVRTERFRRHLKRCSECRATLRAYEKARGLYRDLADDGPSASVREEILRGSRAALSSAGRWRRFVYLAAAATLLLAVAVYVIRGQETETISTATACQALRDEGARLANESKPQEALAKYNEAANCDPTSPMVAGDLHRQGLLYTELGERDDALERLHIVLDLYPGYNRRPEVILQVADILETNGNVDGALAAYRQYVEEYPEDRHEAQRRIESMKLSEETLRALRSLGYIQ